MPKPHFRVRLADVLWKAAAAMREISVPSAPVAAACDPARRPAHFSRLCTLSVRHRRTAVNNNAHQPVIRIESLTVSRRSIRNPSETRARDVHNLVF